METSCLRLVLRNLCSNSPWNYSVLWRPHHGNSRVLIYKDAYLDDCIDGRDDNACSYEDSPLGIALSQLANFRYLLGDGLVGTLASDGGHYWLFSDGLCLVETNLIFPCPEEWLMQLSLGVKTILLVSVIPCGVLQLGSISQVCRDGDEVARIRASFAVFPQRNIQSAIHRSWPSEGKTEAYSDSSVKRCVFAESFDPTKSLVTTVGEAEAYSDSSYMGRCLPDALLECLYDTKGPASETRDGVGDQSYATCLASVKSRLNHESDDVHTKDEQNIANGTERRAKQRQQKKRNLKDRQLIQERVKELRELVPIGSKCSIDELLDKTVKHMLYLISVTEQAENLKKLIRHKDEGDINDGSGRSWAFEWGSGFQSHPLVVEDLACPGYMRIEMVCREEEMFFEMAEVIRRMKVRIVKGGVERRGEGMRASFVVESVNGVHRLDVLRALMRRLLLRRAIPSADDS